jgi:protein-tyrosine-phosphatase
MEKINFPYRSILFVCDVNTCRSPMAEAMLKKMFHGMDDTFPKPRVSSGGIASHAREGGIVSLDALLLMKEEGADSFLEGFRSIDLRRHIDLIREADLILTMTQIQKGIIKGIEEANGKEIYTLKEFAGEVGDIEDPAGKGNGAYLLCKEEIKRCLEKAIRRLIETTGGT